ncbi:hypothetical protein GCM10007972_06150 [Iodidimonas muriae]|uniref:Core domain-containing protein n=1 Tax=Iodidimonas muriae TaxID=261467 RepID=A0ABQ2L8Y9_9PROT|nr:iron-sulfur cluster assembly accessory protein [Iodidimonas muriae]GER05849.1 hypothetical protein JCM17843_01590 [Kordiimonadales bacterium JCM 17843]GGO07127.1 hypothetical protein GCM10007972_06150 [Iodidimonas muriae]
MTAEFEITEKAAAHIKALMAKRDTPALGIRLYTKAAGCSGLMYKVDYVETARDDDAVVDVADVKLFIDKESLPYLKGARMDWKDDKFETGFVFDNPNAKALCGCGESFMV